MDINRLGNVIFSMGEKIPESTFKNIMESIESEQFTLNEYVIEYKKMDSIHGNIVFILEDATSTLVQVDLLEQLRSLNVDKDRLIKFMSKSQANFKSVIEVLINGDF